MGIVSKLALDSDYGLVVLTATASVFEYMWMSFRVSKARVKYGIKVPKMYADKDDCNGVTKDITTFNCIQRSHQNSLECYPQFLTLLMVGGLQNPRVAAASGVVVLIGRALYVIGYSTGEPEKRHWGAVELLGVATFIGLNIKFAHSLLTFRP